jgi:hypothetical protein
MKLNFFVLLFIISPNELFLYEIKAFYLNAELISYIVKKFILLI